MCLLIWTVFLGELCGPWASCYHFMCTTIKSWWLIAWIGCQFPYQIWITMTDSKVKTVNEEISRLSKFSLLAFCSAVIFKTRLKCVYIVKKKKNTGRTLYFYHTSMYSYAIFRWKVAKRGKYPYNIPIYYEIFPILPYFSKHLALWNALFLGPQALEALYK